VDLRERFLRVCNFKDVDRTFNQEMGYWEETLQRWHEEGLPEGIEREGETELLGYGQALAHYFKFDMHWHGKSAPIDYGGMRPPFEERVIEEDEETITFQNSQGIICRDRKRMKTIPHYIKFPVETEEDFENIVWRYNPEDPGRYPQDWDIWVEKFKNRTYPLGISISGFFGQPRNWMGLENLCVAYYENPRLVHRMCEFWLEFNMRLYERALQDVQFDFAQIWEDMAYKAGPLISPKLFREFMSPYYRRLVDFLHKHGIKIVLVDTDGRIDELIPLFLEVGVNGLYPIEIAADNDPVEFRKQYPELIMIGGVDKRQLSKTREDIRRELMSKLPYLLERGGYMPGVDHLVPPDVSLDNFKYYTELKWRIINGESV